MSESQTGKPADNKQNPASDKTVEAAKPTQVETRETFTQEASATQRSESTETARAMSGVTPGDNTEKFVADIELKSLTEHSVAFADGAKVEFSNNLPKELTGPDGSVTKFQWEGGKLNGIELPDGTKWQFQDGKWQHSDAAGNTVASADGLPFINGAKPGTITGPVTEATVRRLNNGYLTAPQVEVLPTTAKAAEAIVPKTLTGEAPPERALDAAVALPVPPGEVKPAATSFSPETLTAAVDSLRNNMNDRHKVEATLRAIPAENKEQFEQLYRQTTNRDLRAELHRRGMDSSIALLDPKEETRQASWLQSNLKNLSRLGADSSERALVEHNIRLNLRGMTDGERQALSQDLQQKTGKNLEQTLADSPLSEPSRKIALLYAKNGNNLNADQLREVADTALNSKVPSEQKLLMVKEAFSGDSDAAKQARQQFMGSNGEGEAKLRQAFRNDNEFKQARDYAQGGRLDTATFIDLQSSKLADSDKGVELVLNMMTPDQHKMFDQGQRLAQSGKTEGGDAKETEALRYYQRVHDALGRASESYTSPSRWFESNRARVATNWEDIAANGEQTLVGRLASAPGRVNVIDAITNFTERDQALMNDPAYRKQVWDLLGGPPGTDENTVYSRTKLSGIETEAAREQLAKVFPENMPPEVSVAARHPTLAEAADNYVRMDKREPFVPHGPSYTFEALMHAKPEDYAALSGEQRRMLNARIELIPDGARDSAKAMQARLQAGQDVQPTVAEQVFLSSLNNVSRQTIAEAVLKQPDDVRKDPAVEKALRFAFGQDFEKYGKSVLDGKGISAENLIQMNTQKGLFSNTIDQASYFDGLKLIPGDQRQQILSAADKGSNNDPDAKKLLDATFAGLSPEQREVAINVLRNPNQEFTLADQIRAKSLGANIDEQRLIDGFAKMTPQDRLAQINDYTARYKRFLPDDLAKNGDENQKRQIELTLPMSRGDLDRAFRDQVRDTGRGLYGNTTITEISIGEAQNQFQSQLIDQLPPEKREQAQKDIDTAFQKYVQSVRENSEAKDQYARDLAEKVMMVATTVGAALPVGTTLVRLALTTATAIAARGTTEHLIKGSVTSSDMTEAAILGTIDGATLGRATAFKGLFEKSVTTALEKQLGADGVKAVVRSVDDGLQAYIRAGERDRLPLEMQLTDQLKRKGVSEPEKAARDILNSFRAQALPVRLEAAFAEVPGSKEAVQDLLKLGKNDALKSAVEKGLISEEQMKTINGMVLRSAQAFAENPAIREQALKDVKWVSENLRFITEGAANPTQAKTYADVFLLAAKNRSVPIPLEALRGAEPKALNFYRDQMTGAIEHFKPPGADSVAGARYEFAMQTEIMDAIAKSKNPEMRNWVFIPGAKGSTADHAGMDGALVNIKDGRVMPVDLKSYDIGDATRWATHIQGSRPSINFNDRTLYNQRTGRLMDDVKPQPGAVEAQLLRLMSDHPNWAIKPESLAEMNPASRIHFPGLGDTPGNDDVVGLRAQVARMKEFIAQTDKGGGDSNVALLRQRLQSPQNGRGGLQFVEKELARVEAEQAGRVAAENVAKLKAVDPTLTEAELKGVFALRDQLSKANPGAALPSDRTLIAAQRSFDRLGVKPTNADFAALLAAKTPEDIERVVADNMVRKMSGLLQDLGRSSKPDEASLSTWSELFRDKQTGAIDREMLREIAKDPYENRQLKELLARVYKDVPQARRQQLIERAIDRIVVL